MKRNRYTEEQIISMAVSSSKRNASGHDCPAQQQSAAGLP